MYKGEEHREHKTMETLRLTVKRSLLSLFGMMVSAALCSSSTVPSFLPLALERRDIAGKQVVPAASTPASVAKGHRQGRGKATAPRLAASKAKGSASSKERRRTKPGTKIHGEETSPKQSSTARSGVANDQVRK